MNKKIRDALLASALAVGALGGGVAAAAQTATTTTEAATTSTTTTDGSSTDSAPTGERPDRAEHEARRAERDAALAEKLGVTTDELTAARTAAREAVDAELGEPERPAKPAEGSTERPAERPELTDEQKAAMAERHALFQEKFAAELGVSVDELKAAEVALAKEHLAEAVASGRITQEQADERLAAIEAGEVGPGFGGPGGPGGGHGHGPR